MEDKKYPIGGFAPENYHCRCGSCERSFLGDKRAYQCESCAIASRKKFDSLSLEEQVELMKRNSDAIHEAFKNWGKPDANLAIIGNGKPDRRPAGSNVWVRASDQLPLHKAFWNMPGEHNNNECYFPVRIDGHKYRVGEIYDERQAGAPDPIYMMVINGDDYYEKDFHRIEWLCESNEQPFEQKESEAVAFAEWIAINNWVLRNDKETWHWGPIKTPKDQWRILTTKQLYNEYQKQNKR